VARQRGDGKWRSKRLTCESVCAVDVDRRPPSTMTVRHRQLRAHSIYLCHYLPSLTYRCRVPPLRAISATILVATGQSRTGEPAWQVDIYSCVTSPGLVKYRTETFCFKWRVTFNNKSFFFNCYILKLRDTHRTSLKCYADFLSPFCLIFYFVSGNLEFLCIFIYIHLY